MGCRGGGEVARFLQGVSGDVIRRCRLLRGWFAVSFTLELAMVPRFGLEVSPALIAFGEMLMMPYAAMQSVVEDELSVNAALERLEAGDCPICRGGWRAGCPVCSAPAGPAAGFAERPDHGLSAEVAAAESDTAGLLRADTTNSMRSSWTTPGLLAS